MTASIRYLVCAWTVAASGTLLPLTAARAPQPTASITVPPIPPQFNPEFPPQDAGLWGTQRIGELKKVTAIRRALAPDDPQTPGLVASVERRMDEGLRLLSTLVEQHPERIAEAFPGIDPLTFTREPAHDYVQPLRDITAAARKRIAGLPREDAARAALAIDTLERRLARQDAQSTEAWRSAFVQQYAGTETAHLVEVDVAAAGRSIPGRIDALEAFAREHPGTVAAAKARYLAAFEWSSNIAVTGIERRGSDPTERILHIIDIVKDLESGRYPPCEWVDRARTMVPGIYASSPVFSMENAERVLTAYEEYIASHLNLPGPDSAGDNIGYLISAKMAPLFAQRGDRIAGAEAMFARLEQTSAARDRAAFQRGLFYMQTMIDAPAARDTALQKAIDTFKRLETQGSGRYQRKALATLATLFLLERDFANARDAYRRYVEVYPQTDWSWIAALRAGQSEAALGDWKAAAASYRLAAANYPASPAASLAYVYLGRALEPLSQVEDALAAYRLAVERWDPDYEQLYSNFSIFERRPMNGGRAPTTVLYDPVLKAALEERLQQLAEASGIPGGAMLARGRSLADRGQFDEAIASLADMMTRYPDSPAVPEARYVSHAARVKRAFDLVATDGRSAALRELELVAAEPYDFGVFMAKVGSATTVFLQGNSARAAELMREALTEWSRQPLAIAAGAAPTLDEDVRSIRRLLFTPVGNNDVYGDNSWNGMRWPSSMPAFVIMPPDLTVKLASGDVRTVRAPIPPPAGSSIVYLTPDQMAFLELMIEKLGGTERRTPGNIMEVPNQPAGGSAAVLRFWNQFFPAHPGHWSGWEFDTWPVVGAVTFVDEARTRATVPVVIGYAGATAVLEKQNGMWKVVSLANRWVT